MEEAVFKKGLAGKKVICEDEKMDGCGPALKEGKEYTILQFTPPEQCDTVENNDICHWDKNEGRVELKEHPGTTRVRLKIRRP